MKLENIHHFFQSPQPIFLGPELAVCYLLSVLSNCESYGTELLLNLEKAYPIFRLSDTVLYSAIKFLEDEQAITSYWQKVESRGRPRRMYKLVPQWQARAVELAALWQNYAQQKCFV